jgi:hypothetical protein
MNSFAVILGATRDTNDRYDDIKTVFDFAFNGP